MEPKRKYRGALRVVELQAEVERLLAEVPAYRGRPALLGATPGEHEAWSAWHDAMREVRGVLSTLWGVSPKRAHAVAERFGLGDPGPRNVRLNAFDKFRHRRRDEHVPCGQRITGYGQYVKVYCKRAVGHGGWCSESKF